MDPSMSPAAPLRLPAELTIYTVGELHPQWLAWLLAAPPDAGVHGGDVDQLDAAGVQLLLALQRAFTQRGQRFVLHTPSAVLSSGCQAMGLGPWLAQHREGATA
jgi:anti-anti-sigma regulatory factor